ncbi:hypothetical protein J7E50_01175 [Pedobacter sp. ISL-68]|uniref:hypothetical protein n=1 Tax=unclassified Pedobacter TaxID=2628915 RepID=UPI001BE7F39E|nr:MULTISPECIES: hypothetical protein [unclassified Pedobacter]MBT2564600.1 hypothetical protein [Pedobacter sp. ISL-64]MBT2588812.1 hypothetical protein [Pedobacter sp. ISL-68]
MNENKNVDPNGEINHNEEDIEWDNGEATYGHKRADFKRKDQPDEAHLAKTENDPKHHINEGLKNANLSQNEDIGNRNKERDKGISGKDL